MHTLKWVLVNSQSNQKKFWGLMLSSSWAWQYPVYLWVLSFVPNILEFEMEIKWNCKFSLTRKCVVKKVIFEGGLLWPLRQVIGERNRTFPHSLVPLFQSESKWETILMKMFLICMKMNLHAKLIFIWKVSHLDSFWNRGIRELGNGLLKMVHVRAILLSWTIGKTAQVNLINRDSTLYVNSVVSCVLHCVKGAQSRHLELFWTSKK